MVSTILQKLRESREPSKGIFWFVKEDTAEDFDILYLDIPESEEIIGNSKNGLTFTHQKTWKDLAARSPSDIREKEWNYFPRGRVELRNNKAYIYLNPHINKDPYLGMIVNAFNLQRISYRFIADGSFHYHCYLDEEG